MHVVNLVMTLSDQTVSATSPSLNASLFFVVVVVVVGATPLPPPPQAPVSD